MEGGTAATRSWHACATRSPRCREPDTLLALLAEAPTATRATLRSRAVCSPRRSLRTAPNQGSWNDAVKDLFKQPIDPTKDTGPSPAVHAVHAITGTGLARRTLREDTPSACSRQTSRARRSLVCFTTEGMRPGDPRDPRHRPSDLRRGPRYDYVPSDPTKAERLMRSGELHAAPRCSWPSNKAAS